MKNRKLIKSLPIVIINFNKEKYTYFQTLIFPSQLEEINTLL